MKITGLLIRFLAALCRTAFAFAAVFSAVSFYKFPQWLNGTFGSVSPEQLLFFIKAPLKGTDPVFIASFAEEVIKQPLIIAAIAALPALIMFSISAFLPAPKKAPLPGPLKILYASVFLCVAAALGCCAAVPSGNKPPTPVKFYNAAPSGKGLSDPRFLIAHAGGAVGGKIYTNSAESAEKAAADGFGFVELDLDETSDGKIAALHDWKYFRGITGEVKNDSPMTLAEFRSRKIYGRYTPLDYAGINGFMERHPNIVLVTDKIRDFRKLTENFRYPDRIITEVFSISDYKKALACGILYPAFSLNTMKTVDLAAISRAGIRMITVSDVYLEKFPEEITYLHRRGVTVMLYAPSKVINDPAYLQSVLGKKASMAYVDFCSPKNPECRH